MKTEKKIKKKIKKNVIIKILFKISLPKLSILKSKAKEVRNSKVKIEELLNFILTNHYFESGFEGILEIIEIYCSLPCTNAEVERGFSAMNRIKTTERNHLLPQTLGSLIMISLNGPPVEI